jgi:hypothetical protein
MDKNTFLSIVTTFYYKSDSKFDHGLHEEVFEHVSSLLGLSEIPASVKTWMSENKIAKDYYKVPPVTKNVDEEVEMICGNELVFDNIISQLRNCTNKNHKVFFKDGTSRRVDTRSAGVAIRALRSNKIKPETRMKFQEFCKESFGNLMKFVSTAKSMGL